MDQPDRPSPRSVLIVGAAALLWSLAGTAMFLMQVTLTPGALARMEPAQRSIYEATPTALNVAFGIAVLAGVLGAVGLLLRRSWAVQLLLISLIAIVAQMAMAFAMTPAWVVLGPAGLIFPALLVVLAAVFWAYARRANRRGWLS